MTIDNHDNVNFLYLPDSVCTISPCFFQFFSIWCTWLRETPALFMATECCVACSKVNSKSRCAKMESFLPMR